MSVDNHLDLTVHLRAAGAALLAATTARLDGVDPASVSRFTHTFASMPPGSGYKYIPPDARALHAGVAQQHGEAIARTFLFAAVVSALCASLASPQLQRLPARVLAHQLRHYQRIITEPALTASACELDNDLFHKDFGLAALRLYGGGSNLIDFNSGMGRSALWKGGAADLPRRLAIFARVGGFRPFFEIHAHKFYMDEFNEEGRNECYRCCAELYALHHEVRGMIAGSWFYDPAIAAISPHLAYLRTVPQQGGAHLLFDSFDDGAARNAIATSATRKRLFEAGTYKPAAYMLVWPRARQIAWALGASVKDSHGH